MLLHVSDQAKYGKLIEGLQSQFSLGQDLYPRKLKGASEALANHKWDQYPKQSTMTESKTDKKKPESNKTEKSFAQSGKQNGKQSEGKKAEKSDLWCFGCGKTGVTINDCNCGTKR